MTDHRRYEAGLRRILAVLEPYADELVVIGGWVPHLYQRYGGFSTWRTRTSLTTEVDILVMRPLPPGERASIPEILTAAGFSPTDAASGVAVWEGDTAAGERIEFLVPHTGTSRGQGVVVSVASQRGMGAIPLPRLELMRTFRRRLTLPVATTVGKGALQVWVPSLGAYVVNKASIFLARREHVGGGNPKRAKDLLYLRDLVGAGPEVVARIETDLREMLASEQHRAAAESIRYARNMLHLTVSDASSPLVPEVARMLSEREPALPVAAGIADVRGYLSDLLDVFDGARS